MYTLALEPDIPAFEYIAEAVKCLVITDIVARRFPPIHLHVLDFLHLKRRGTTREATSRVVDGNLGVVPVVAHPLRAILVRSPVGSFHKIHAVLSNVADDRLSRRGPIVDLDQDRVVFPAARHCMSRRPMLNVVVCCHL